MIARVSLKQLTLKDFSGIDQLQIKTKHKARTVRTFLVV